MAPDDYVEGLKAVDLPMLVLIGSKDEVFSAEVLRKAVEENSDATVYMVKGALHNGVRHQPESFEYIKKWFSEL